MSQKQLAVSSFGGNLNAAAVALGPAGGTIFVDVRVTLIAAFVPVGNVTLRGVGAGSINQLTAGANVVELFNGQSGCQFLELTMNGGRAAVSGFGCPSTTIQGCRISGSTFRGLDFGAGASNLSIKGNLINGFAAGATDGIFCEDVGAGLIISNNVINTIVTDHCIGVHTNAGTCIAPIISENTLTHKGQNFAIEVGAFNSGTRVDNAVVSDNLITLVNGAGSFGAISLNLADTPRVTGNSIDMGGVVPSIQAIEFAVVNYGKISDNIVVGAGAQSGAVVLDSSSNNVVSGNTLGGYVTIVNSGTHAGVLTITANQLKCNTITIPQGSSQAYCFLVKANVANCNADNNEFIANTITSPISMAAIHLENDYSGGGGATINGTVDAGNTVLVR